MKQREEGNLNMFKAHITSFQENTQYNHIDISQAMETREAGKTFVKRPNKTELMEDFWKDVCVLKRGFDDKGR